MTLEQPKLLIERLTDSLKQKAPDARTHQGLFLRLEGTSDGIAGNRDERGLRLFLPFYFFTFLLFNEFPISVGKVVDELSSSFGPYEIGMGVGSAHFLLSAIALRVEEGAVAGTALG